MELGQGLSRRRMLGLMGMAAVVASCGDDDDTAATDTTAAPGSSGASTSPGTGGSSSAPSGGGGSLKVGLVVPQSGVYAPLGVDMKNAWDLWLAQHDGVVGGREVQTVVADEGEGPDTGVPAVQKLIQDDNVDVLVGIVNSAIALGSKDLVTESKKLLIIANAGANDITGAQRSPYIWRVSFSNSQTGFAVGQHLATVADVADAVYALAPDYAAGNESVGGFRNSFEAGGGTVVGESFSPFGTTQDFQPFLSQVEAAGAKATYAFYSGGEAIAFVKQYAEFGLAGEIPLYGTGFLTEGAVLEEQGDSALGVRTGLHYATSLDNEANTAFVQAYADAYDGADTTVFAMQTWDAASVLDKAVTAAGAIDSDSLSAALGTLGSIDDSPRGPWTFDNQNPKQVFYLREVVDEGGTLSNKVLEELGTFAQP